MLNFINSFFKIKENNTTIKTEIIAGVTTYMTIAYIIFVNPNILMQVGIDKGAATIATCLVAAIATTVMAILANYPFALAPGLGLSTYFASVVLGMEISWQTALGAVFISGVCFIILNMFNFREMIIGIIPDSLKNAIAAGIGTFIAFHGLRQAGIIIPQASSLSLGTLQSPPTLLALLGIILIGVLMKRKVKGAILWGIIVITAISIILTQIGLTPGLTTLPHQAISLPPSLAPTFLQLDILGTLKLSLLHVVFIFFFIDLFDTVGTVVGLGKQAGYIKKDGHLRKINKVFLADAIGTVSGSLLGTAAATTYMESSSGIAEGGRTGLTAITTAGMFLLSIFLFPLIIIVPVFATAPALVVVGSIMLKNISRIDWKDPAISISSFITILGMPLAYSIADGMALGFIFYTGINMLSGNAKKVHWFMYVLTLIFVIRLLIIMV